MAPKSQYFGSECPQTQPINTSIIPPNPIHGGECPISYYVDNILLLQTLQWCRANLVKSPIVLYFQALIFIQLTSGIRNMSKTLLGQLYTYLMSLGIHDRYVRHKYLNRFQPRFVKIWNRFSNLSHGLPMSQGQTDRQRDGRRQYPIRSDKYQVLISITYAWSGAGL